MNQLPLPPQIDDGGKEQKRLDRELYKAQKRREKEEAEERERRQARKEARRKKLVHQLHFRRKHLMYVVQKFERLLLYHVSETLWDLLNSIWDEVCKSNPSPQPHVGQWSTEERFYDELDKALSWDDDTWSEQLRYISKQIYGDDKLRHVKIPDRDELLAHILTCYVHSLTLLLTGLQSLEVGSRKLKDVDEELINELALTAERGYDVSAMDFWKLCVADTVRRMKRARHLWLARYDVANRERHERMRAVLESVVESVLHTQVPLMQTVPIFTRIYKISENTDDERSSSSSSSSSDSDSSYDSKFSNASDEEYARRNGPMSILRADARLPRSRRSRSYASQSRSSSSSSFSYGPAVFELPQPPAGGGSVGIGSSLPSAMMETAGRSQHRSSSQHVKLPEGYIFDGNTFQKAQRPRARRSTRKGHQDDDGGTTSF